MHFNYSTLKNKNFMKSYIILLLGILISSFSFGQGRYSIGVQGGLLQLNTFSSSGSNEVPGFSPLGTLSGTGQVYGKYFIGNKSFAKLGLGLIHLGMTTTLEGIKSGNVASIGGRTLNRQVIAAFGQDFNLGKNGWGFYWSGGISLTKLNLEGDRVYSLSSEEGIRFQGIIIKNNQGDASELLAYDMRVFKTRHQSIWHLRPELGIFKHLGRSRISASYIYAYQLREEPYSVYYNSLSYFGKNYSASHGTSGSFSSIQLAYEIRF
jgi:hypothetical protein